ncbi:MAG: hypothetical protein WC380_00200 [Pedobacter sp.]|jgi:hypothetical protein
MKAIIENKNTYKVTGERGDFFITEDNRGKIKMFVKSTVEIVEIDALPKAKKYSAGRVPSDAQYAQTRKMFAMAEANDLYLPCQVSRMKF